MQKTTSSSLIKVCFLYYNKEYVLSSLLLISFLFTASSLSAYLFCFPTVLYLGSPFGMGKEGGCSPSRLPGADGGVSRALWWEEVSSSGSTVWQDWSFRWKRWPQYRNLWDTVKTFEKAERSANVTAHWRQKETKINFVRAGKPE